MARRAALLLGVALLMSVDALPDLAFNADRLKQSMDIVRKVFAPDACPVLEGCVDRPGLRRLLRFDTVTMNMGDSDFAAGVPDTSNPQFVWDPCHRRMLGSKAHESLYWHFNGFAAYRIFQSNYTGNFDNSHLIGLGRKRAYCMLDTERIPDYAGPARATERYTCDDQGISAGWQDIYPKYIDCQWIDITDYEPGDYTMQVVVDVENKVQESNEENNIIYVNFTIPEACPVIHHFAANVPHNFQDPLDNEHMRIPGLVQSESVAVALPFEYQWFCKKTNRVVINQNGLVCFNNQSGYVTSRPDVSQDPATDCVSAYWAPMATREDGGSGDVYFAVQGQPGQREVRITWYRVARVADDDVMPGNDVTFQVVLHEDRQDVEVHYVDTRTTLPEWTNGGQSTIGICGETPETCQMYRHFTVQQHRLVSGTSLRMAVGVGNAESDMPVAMVGGPYVTRLGSPTVFDGRASHDPQGTQLTEYYWDFGDRDPPGEGPTTMHTYRQAGYYQVCLRVANNLRTSPENCTSVNVLDTACDNCAPGKNYILDPSFSVMALPTVETFGTGWQPITSGDRSGYEVSSMSRTPAAGATVGSLLVNASANQLGAMQVVKIRQSGPVPIQVTGWARVMEEGQLSRSEDFAMTVDFHHTNGTIVRRVLPFEMTASMRDGWQHRNYTYNATTPVLDVEISLLYNGSAPGAVVFDDVTVTPLETGPDSEWGDWETSSPCNATCSSPGVMVMKRACKPGRICVGPDTITHGCVPDGPCDGELTARQAPRPSSAHHSYAPIRMLAEVAAAFALAGCILA